MSLTKKQIKEWKGLLKGAVLGTVAVEMRQNGKDTYINILRFLNGKMPESEQQILDGKLSKHMMHQGHLAPKMMLQKFMKINSNLDLDDLTEEQRESVKDTCHNLQDAPEEVITDLMTDGVLYNYVADLYVYSYYKLNYELIAGAVARWDEVKLLLDSIVDSQKAV